MTGADLQTDYTIWDSREDVTYYSHASAGDTAYTLTAPDGNGAAKRRPLKWKEQAASAGAYIGQDRVWLVPNVLLPAALARDGLKAGDWVRDSSGVDWTVLEAEKIVWGTAWKLTTRALVLVYGLRDSVTILRPTNTQDVVGNRVPAYAAAYSAIAGKLQELQGERQEEHGKIGFLKRYAVYLGQRVTVTTEDRVQVDGVTYQITGYRDPDRLDVLMTLDVERLP